jgi:proteic killer suppression protein
MIISFGCKETEKIWNGIAVKKPALQIQQIERRKQKMRTCASQSIRKIRWRFEKLL